MKKYKYQAKKGMDLVKGILAADSKEEAIDQINNMGLIPVELVEEGAEGQKAHTARGMDPFAWKVGSRSLNILYRQLGRLLKSGIPLLPGLVLTAEQCEDKKLRPILEAVKNQVRQGTSLAEAMANHPLAFNAFAVSMVELGENTGHLDEALGRLAECCERQTMTIQKIRNALLYPSFIVTLGGLALVFLLAYVVPKFSKLFSELGQTLPWMTRLLVKISEVAQHYGLGAVLVIAATAFIVRIRLRIRSNRIRWDRMKIGLPLLGKVFFMAPFAAFSRSMEMLLRGGVPLLRALKTALPAVSNEALKEELFLATSRVEQGATLSDSLKVSQIFPMFAIHLLLIGEQTGRLEQSFNDIADWYEQEVGEQTRIITQLIEPMTILILGLSLGFVAMAILLPVFSMDAIIS